MCCGGVRRCVLVTNFEHTHAIRNVTADLVMNNRPNYDVAVQLYRYSLSWKILSDPTLIIPLIVYWFAGIVFAAYLHLLRPIWSSLSDCWIESCITFTEALSWSGCELNGFIPEQKLQRVPERFVKRISNVLWSDLKRRRVARDGR